MLIYYALIIINPNCVVFHTLISHQLLALILWLTNNYPCNNHTNWRPLHKYPIWLSGFVNCSKWYIWSFDLPLPKSTWTISDKPGRSVSHWVHLLLIACVFTKLCLKQKCLQSIKQKFYINLQKSLSEPLWSSWLQVIIAIVNCVKVKFHCTVRPPHNVFFLSQL